MIATHKRIEHLVASGNAQKLKAYLTEHHPADIASAILTLRPDTILLILETADTRKSVDIFSELPPETQKTCIEHADTEHVLHFFAALSPDDQADLLKILDPEGRDKLLSKLKKSDREELLELTRYPEDTAGAVMTTQYFTLLPESTVAQATDQVKKMSREAENIYTLYVADAQDVLRGVVSLKDILLADPDKPLSRIMNPNVICAFATEDVEDVAEKISRYDLIALPVVDSEKKIVGVITVDDVIDIMEDEATEDFYALGAAGAPLPYIGGSILKLSRERITWLLVLVVTGFLAGGVLQFFQKELLAYMQLAFFIPLLNDSGGNAGSQSTTIIIRGLATGELTSALWARILWIEFRIGLVVGTVMGVLAAFRAIIMNHDWHLGITVGLSMVVIVTFAKTVGGMLPVAFKKINLDPAVVSAPLITSLVDILALVVYFSLARLFLPGL